MTPERWQQIEATFRAALEQSPEDRSGYLEQACGDDAALMRDVASLLAAHEEAGSFLDAPAARLPEAFQARLFRPDETVACRFRIVRFLAEGGMGEVYEAFDTELEERVALKTIRQSILDDDEAEQRFTRERQLARKISHPNVCRIHDVFHHTVQSGNFDGQIRFLTMEFLGGETLARRLRRGGPMTVERALPIARQIAEGLRAAHAAGIVHRDVKPDNVMLVPTGGTHRAVVMDFGVARDRTALEGIAARARGDLLWMLHGLQAARNPPKGALGRLARRARRQMVALGIVSDAGLALTELGRVLGTPAYMAPEQARGERADERADIWAFGIVFYEMLAGKLPFRPRSSLYGLVGKLLGRAHRPAPLSRRVPVGLRRVIERCLEPRARDRYPTADALLRDLDAVEIAPGGGRALLWSVVIATVAGVLTWLTWLALGAR